MKLNGYNYWCYYHSNLNSSSKIQFRFSHFYELGKKPCDTTIAHTVCDVLILHWKSLFTRKYNQISPDSLLLYKGCNGLFHLNSGSTPRISAQAVSSQRPKRTRVLRATWHERSHLCSKVNVLTKPRRLHARGGQPGSPRSPASYKRCRTIDLAHPAPGLCSLPCMGK